MYKPVNALPIQLPMLSSACAGHSSLLATLSEYRDPAAATIKPAASSAGSTLFPVSASHAGPRSKAPTSPSQPSIPDSSGFTSFALPAWPQHPLFQPPERLRYLAGMNKGSAQEGVVIQSVLDKRATNEDLSNEKGDPFSTLLTLRDYQQALMTSILESMQRGEDRGLIRAPTQTGKSLLIAPLVLKTQQLLPGKTTLVLSPFKIITQQILDDLTGMLPGMRIGLIDAAHKDFAGAHDIVIASAFTLGREKHLKRIDPDRFGLIIVDEATYGMAKTWQRILTRLRFLYPSHQVRRNGGKYLLGLTADPYNLKKVFGDGKHFAAHGLKWFMDHGYLHKIAGLRVAYEPHLTSHLEETGDETRLIPETSAVQSEAVASIYEKYLFGKRTLIWTSTIQHAQSHEQIFNHRFGEGYAKAVYGGMPEEEKLFDILKGYSQGTGPTVIISIYKLAHGLRAHGTEGMIHDYQTGSLRRYGQRIGRPLGIAAGEPQRTMLNIDLINRGPMADNLVTLPRFLNLTHRFNDGIPFLPFQLSQQQDHAQRNRRRRLYEPYRGKQLAFRYASKETPFLFREGLLQRQIEQLFRDRYGGDLTAMAHDLDMDLDEVDRYRYGALPKHLAEVQRIAKYLGIEAGKLLRAWEDDALEAIDYVHPIPEEYGPCVREFLELIRRATVRAGGIGSTKRALKRLGCDDHQSYAFWSRLFNGAFPKPSHASGVQHIHDILTSARFEKRALLSSGEAVFRFEEALAEEETRLQDVHVQEIFPGLAEDVEQYAETAFIDSALWGADAADPFQLFADKQDALTLRRLVGSLDPRQQLALTLRFGLDGEDEHTLAEAGKRFGVMGETARLHEGKALRKLRHRSSRQYLSPFADEASDAPSFQKQWKPAADTSDTPLTTQLDQMARWARYSQDLVSRLFGKMFKDQERSKPWSERQAHIFSLLRASLAKMMADASSASQIERAWKRALGENDISMFRPEHLDPIRIRELDEGLAPLVHAIEPPISPRTAFDPEITVVVRARWRINLLHETMLEKRETASTWSTWDQQIVTLIWYSLLQIEQDESVAPKVGQAWEKALHKQSFLDFHPELLDRARVVQLKEDLESISNQAEGKAGLP